MDERDEYTDQPTHLRIFMEEPGQWALDAADNDLRFTQQIYTFETHEAAVAGIPNFLRDLKEDGLTFTFDTHRTGKARCVSLATWHYKTGGQS